MKIGFFCFNKEDMAERPYKDNLTAIYLIYITPLLRFGYGIRINIFSRFLIGAFWTNDGLPDPPEIAETIQAEPEQSKQPEQLPLPFGYPNKPEDCPHTNLETVCPTGKNEYKLCYNCGAHLTIDGKIIDLHPQHI